MAVMDAGELDGHGLCQQTIDEARVTCGMDC